MQTVAVDIDGVIYDIIQHIIDKFRPHLTCKPNNWDCWDELETNKGEFFKMYSECWIEAATNSDIANKYTDPSAKKLFRKLQRSKNLRTAIITKRSKADVIYTVQYLKQQDFHFDTFTVITDVKDKVSEHFDMIIEDNPKNLPDTFSKSGVLLTQPWNKYFDVKSKINCYRYDNLDSISYRLQYLLPLPDPL
jgi:5'(3')-deoxyribonucleotidase